MASWTFDYHTEPTTKVHANYFPKTDNHPAFAAVHVGDVMSDMRLFINSQEFCTRMIETLETVRAQIAFVEMVEEEEDSTPSCP